MLKKRMGYEAWINSGFRQSTKNNYKLGYDLFIKFMNESEDGTWSDIRLIKEREEDLNSRNFVFEQKVLEFYEWMKSLVQQDREVLVQRKNCKPYKIKIKGGKKLSDNTRQAYTHGVMSFFTFHRLDLKFTRQQARILNKEAKPVIKYYDFTLEDIKRMNRVAKPKERYVLLVGRSIGLRGGDFVLLKQGSFLAHLDEEPCSLGEIFTTKEGATATPFLDTDAKETAKSWLTILKAKGRYGRDGRMLEIDEESLTDIIKKLVVKAGIETGNEQVRFHQLRSFLITRLSKVMEENRWKQIVGKKVPEKAYVKPFEIREDFKKVIPLIAVSERSVISKQVSNEISRLEDRLREEYEMKLKARDRDIEAMVEKRMQERFTKMFNENLEMTISDVKPHFLSKVREIVEKEKVDFDTIKVYLKGKSKPIIEITKDDL